MKTRYIRKFSTKKKSMRRGGKGKKGGAKIINKEDDDKGTYYGDLSGDMRHGKGKMEYEDGHVYTGDWVDDVREGRGTMKYADGSVYKGDWQNNQSHGKGKMIFDTLSTYVGDWKNNKADGIGTYVGCWENNEPGTSCWISEVSCEGSEDPIMFTKIPKGRGFRLEADSKKDLLSGKCYDAESILRLKKDNGHLLGPYTRKPFTNRDLRRRRIYKNRNEAEWQDIETDSDESEYESEYDSESDSG